MAAVLSTDDAAAPALHGAAPGWGFAHESQHGRWLARLTRWTEYLSRARCWPSTCWWCSCRVISATSCTTRWTGPRRVARALMIVLVFFGAATALARSQHVGMDLFRQWLPAGWQPALMQLGHWIIAGVAAEPVRVVAAAAGGFVRPDDFARPAAVTCTCTRSSSAACS